MFDTFFLFNNIAVTKKTDIKYINKMFYDNIYQFL